MLTMPLVRRGAFARQHPGCRYVGIPQIACGLLLMHGQSKCPECRWIPSIQFIGICSPAGAGM